MDTVQKRKVINEMKCAMQHKKIKSQNPKLPRECTMWRESSGGSVMVYWLPYRRFHQSDTRVRDVGIELVWRRLLLTHNWSNQILETIWDNRRRERERKEARHWPSKVRLCICFGLPTFLPHASFPLYVVGRRYSHCIPTHQWVGWDCAW